jgi:small subunit ribosomal protein S8
MAMTDPIADFLTRIRNAVKAKHKRVDIPASKLKKELTRILKDEHYITDYTILDDTYRGTIRIILKYNNGQSVVKGLKRISRPGLRQYKSVDALPRVINGLGVAIVSTPKGMMTDKRARQLGVGGEVICYIW